MRRTLRALMTPRTLVLSLLIVAQSFLLWRVAARERTVPAPQFRYTVMAAPPLPTPPPPEDLHAGPVVPMTLAPPQSTRPSCPPPRNDAPPVPTENLPHDISHVTTSLTNAGWLAAWDNDKVLVSTDAGKTFTQVLDGPGNVDDVTFDCFGHAIVLRDERVGIRDNGKETWRTVPGISKSESNGGSLIGGGPDVITIGRTNDENNGGTLAISADLGATWWYRSVASYWDETTADGHQDADGTIHVVVRTADCMSSPSVWFVISPTGDVKSEDLGDVGVPRLYEDYAIAGWGPMQWKRFGEKTWHDIKGLPAAAQLVSGPLPRAVVEEVIYTVEHGRAKALRPWPYEASVASSAAVDRAGRLFTIGETKDGEDAWLVEVPSTRAPIPPPPSGSQNE